MPFQLMPNELNCQSSCRNAKTVLKESESRNRIKVEIERPTRYRSCEKNVRLESALVRLARNQFTSGEMGRLRMVEW